MSQDPEERTETPNVPKSLVGKTQLPENYQSAKRALSKCNTVDECKKWSDKAGALKSYAYMSRNDELLVLAKRIQAHAARRGGELLWTFDGRPQNASKKQNNTKGTLLTQKEVAKKAGMSKKTKDTFLRLANIPEKDFKMAVESNAPPSLAALAKLGTKKRSSTTSNEKPADCRAAVERALEAMRVRAAKAPDGHDSLSPNGQPLIDIEPNTVARKALMSRIECHPLSDLWWAKELVACMSDDDVAVGETE